MLDLLKSYFAFFYYLVIFVIIERVRLCLISLAEIDEYYADIRYERIAILNALGAYYSYLGKIETKQREKEEHFIQATKYYNKASRIDVHEPSTWVGKGSQTLKHIIAPLRTIICLIYVSLICASQ